MKKLISGILEFRKNVQPTYKDKFGYLAEGQAPDAIFITCADSRIIPNMLSSTAPGDLFIMRNVGNMVPPFSFDPGRVGLSEIAALEFALTNLPIKDIIVCGHSDCGAMQAILKKEERQPASHLQRWLKNCTCTLHQPQLKDPFFMGLAPHNRLSLLNILEQMGHLMTYATIQERVKNKELNLHGWYFDVGTADIYAYEKEFHRFVLVDEEEAKRIWYRLR